LVTAARDLLAQARRDGYHGDDLIRIIQTLPPTPDGTRELVNRWDW
jgi:hypothetical protein